MTFWLAVIYLAFIPIGMVFGASMDMTLMWIGKTAVLNAVVAIVFEAIRWWLKARQSTKEPRS